MTDDADNTRQLSGEDRQLVDLVAAALVDPNLHTDLRLRLHREITELLRNAHADLHGPAAAHAAGPQPLAEAAPAGDQLPKLLERLLVDPNLHTELRLHLHREIGELVRVCTDPQRQRPSETGAGR